jgi:predicted DNA-binding ribbon-helix-helix protein
MKRNSVRTSIDIPAPLHRKLHEAAARRGCSARQLILTYMERLVAEELPRELRRVSLPLVPASGRGEIAGVTNDEALFG